METIYKKVVYLALTLGVLVVLLFMTVTTKSAKKAENGPKKQEAKQEKIQLTKEERIQYEAELSKYDNLIETNKIKLNKNIQSLSNKKWLSHSYEDLVGISPEDMKLIQDNNAIIYSIQPAYLGSAAIKATKFEDKEGARSDLNEYKKIIKSNKYIVQNEELIKIIDFFYKKWEL